MSTKEVFKQKIEAEVALAQTELAGFNALFNRGAWLEGQNGRDDGVHE